MATVEETRDASGSRLSTIGKRDFRTTRLRRRFADDLTPAVASSRAYLRAQLPDVYQDGGFGMRFLEALETVLDPIVATLDALPAYFDPDLAPRDLLDLMAAWLGLTVDESWRDDRVREVLRLAATLGQTRGTRDGLALVLRLAFPDLPLRIDDKGAVTWQADPDAPAEPAADAFVVYCDKPVDKATQDEIAHVIEQAKPVHVGYKLRVRTARKRSDGDVT
jgi:phage tail-like protein